MKKNRSQKMFWTKKNMRMTKEEFKKAKEEYENDKRRDELKLEYNKKVKKLKKFRKPGERFYYLCLEFIVVRIGRSANGWCFNPCIIAEYCNFKTGKIEQQEFSYDELKVLKKENPKKE